jgi:hypothetical protein
VGSFAWTVQDKIGWLDIDQHRIVKLASSIRLVWDGYSQFTVLGAGKTRSEYFTETGWQPVTSYLEITATGRKAHIDDAVVGTYVSTLGHLTAESDRYGGVDAIEWSVEGEPIVTCRHHWLWFSPAKNSLLDHPAEGFTVDQSEKLDLTPAPPSMDGAEEVDAFRWSLRESDINQHVNAVAYIERAENAVAEAEADRSTGSGQGASELRRAGIWFQRPSFTGDRAMALALSRESDILVSLVAKDTGKSLCTVSFGY